MDAKSIMMLGCAALALVGCDSLKNTLGMEKKAPDEFAVVTRAPLSMPPNAELRPPRPGEARPQEPDPQDQARQAVFGASAADTRQAMLNATHSPGEAALLMRAGADNADPGIRREVDQEITKIAAESESLVDELLFWQQGGAVPATVVDAQGEAERLRRNAALGLSASEGETPTVETKVEALF